MAKRYLGGGVSFEQKDVYQEFSEDEGGGGSTTLAGLTDVDITDPTDGQVLVYNAEAGKWENGEAGGGGYKMFEVTFIAYEREYIISAPCITVGPDGRSALMLQGVSYVGTPLKGKLVSFSDYLIIDPSGFEIDESYTPVCTGGVELVNEGFKVSGDGTITCKGIGSA